MISRHVNIERLTMKHILLAAMIGIISLVLFGCSATPIQKQRSQDLEKLVIGQTTYESFRTLFPEAYLGGEDGAVRAYIVEQETYAPFASGADSWTGNVSDRLHFYFRDGRLARWGRPGDWESDFNIAVRQE